MEHQSPTQKRRKLMSQVCILMHSHYKFCIAIYDDLGWFDIDESHNTNVYVSGLPLDITLEEFAEHMTKCGIIMEDEDGTVLLYISFYFLSLSLSLF